MIKNSSIKRFLKMIKKFPLARITSLVLATLFVASMPSHAQSILGFELPPPVQERASLVEQEQYQANKYREAQAIMERQRLVEQEQYQANKYREAQAVMERQRLVEQEQYQANKSREAQAVVERQRLEEQYRARKAQDTQAIVERQRLVEQEQYQARKSREAKTGVEQNSQDIPVKPPQTPKPNVCELNPGKFKGCSVF